MKLNGNDMTILNPGAIEIKRPKKSIFKNGMWQINHVDGIITIPCRIDYNTKEELVDKLNQIDTWLKDGFLYVDDHTKYDVRLIIGMTHQNNFTKFKLMFRTDEFKYEVYQYTYMTPINSLYNPLERQNCRGSMTNPNIDLVEIEINPLEDNIITGDFACVDGKIYASYSPEGYIQNGSEIYRKEDVSE